jgi:hypothetical protein
VPFAVSIFNPSNHDTAPDPVIARNRKQTYPLFCLSDCAPYLGQIFALGNGPRNVSEEIANHVISIHSKEDLVGLWISYPVCDGPSS